MSKKRNYKLEVLHTLGNNDNFIDLIKEFMVGCKILEVRDNRSKRYIGDNCFEFIGCNVTRTDYVFGIEMEYDSPSLLIEREVDKKHFVISMCPIFGWTVYEVVYD